MAIHYPDILHQTVPPSRFRYGPKDMMLYALGIGFGADPLDSRELPFVYERTLKVVPTALTIFSVNPFLESSGPAVPQGMRLSTLDRTKVLHGEQRIELHAPLPVQGSFTTRSRTIAAVDKGRGKGALIINETVWLDEGGVPVLTSTGTMFARGDGGFDGPVTGAPAPHPMPSRAPDVSLDLLTRADQALLYRLNGDFNPLHADPEAATRSGFRRPILHGLCTYGMTCRAVLRAFVDYDCDAIVSHQVRFSSPVYPGEIVTVDMWRDGNVVSFEARVKERNVVVIQNGKTVIR
jgi:acyl dehydratase